MRIGGVQRYALLALIVLFGFYYVVNFLNLISFRDDPSSSSSLLSPSSLDSSANGDGSGSGGLMGGRSYQALSKRIEQLQSLVDSKQADINNLREAFLSNVDYYNNLVSKQKLILARLNANIESLEPSSKKTYTNHLVPSTSNRSTGPQNNNNNNNNNNNDDDDSLLDVSFPNIGNFLHHLNSTNLCAGEGGGGGLLATSLQPKFKISKNRRATISIGIPTIKREKTSYLLETLKSLFDAMNDFEKLEALVVVIIPEIEDNSFIQTTVEQLTKAFKSELDSGLLDVIVPPAEFYPDLAHLMRHDKVFNDSAERVKWRTKQNYDFAYLMAYAQKRGKYYLQLEDDVVSKSGFFTIMKKFIEKQKDDSSWKIIEFSQLGFIGKLFKSRELSLFINFFLMFANDKPVDWLYDSALSVKICNPEKGDEHCERSKSKLKIKYKPSLFQHVGTKSSLKGKTQKLKDKDFGKQTIVSHKNPEARCTTSLKTYMKYTLESAYMGLNYFWSMAPLANDYMLFEFKEPTTILKYYVKSGNPEHPDDKLYNATFHIKPQQPIESSRLPRSYALTTDGYYIIDKFSNELGTVRGRLDPRVTGPLTHVRIHIPSASETWVIISEIDFTIAPPSPTSTPKPTTVTTTKTN